MENEKQAIFGDMRYVILCALAMALLYGCKEDVDETPPVVQILAPSEGMAIVMPDTIAVAAYVEDNERLDILSFGLVDQQLNWVGERVYISNPTNPNEFNLSLAVTDLDIASGTHYLEVLAGDGENDEREFVEVHVTGIPRVYRGTAYLRSTGAEAMAEYVNTTGETTSYAQDEELYMAGDGRYAAVYVYTGSDRTLTSHDLNSAEVNWMISDAIPDGESVVDMLYDEVNRRIYLLTDEPRIFSFSRNGNAYGSYAVDSDYDVLQLESDADDLWLLSNSSSGHRLSRIYRSSGFEIEHFSLDFVPVQMKARSESEVLLVDAAGDLHVVAVDSDSQYSIPVASSGMVNALVMVGETAYFSSNTTVYRYTAGAGQVPAVHSGSDIRGMTYDEVSQRMILAEGSELRFYDLQTWQLLGTIAVGAGASDLQALFNK